MDEQKVDSSSASKLPFTVVMRKATREIHDVSDALVNAKLAFALSDNRVWAEGLLVFYEIFRYLEEAMDRLKDANLGKLDIDGMRRTKAFQEDLDFYLGENWTSNYQPRESVVKYLIHLQKREAEDPNSLLAYVYHLYMGLLSGGQILAKKRSINRKLFPFSQNNELGVAVTSFEDKKISDIKKHLKDAMNSVADDLSEETRNMLLEESKTVFVLNNEMIRTIQGTSEVVIKKIIMAIVIMSLIIVTYYTVLRRH